MIKYVDDNGEVVLQQDDEDIQPCPVVLNSKSLPCIICGAEPVRRFNKEKKQWEIYHTCEHCKCKENQ